MMSEVLLHALEVSAVCSQLAVPVVHKCTEKEKSLQGYLAHKKTLPPRTLQ